jgi:CheY-like chemotaxis protein
LLEHRLTIDLVITDINMPGQMDGAALAGWLALHRPQLPVIVTSALPLKRLLGGDRQRFLRKPYSLETIEALIEQLLKGHNKPGL